MDMRIDAALIRRLRQQRAWSQEHLAEVAGLGLRTVQRVESDGRASFETLRALAAVLDSQADDLLVREPVSSPPHAPAQYRNTTWGKLFAALSVVVLGSWAVLGTTWVSAEQVRLEYELAIGDGESGTRARIAQNNLTLEPGVESEIVIDEQVKFVLSLKVLDDAAVLISSRIYSYTEGEYALMGSPRILVANKKKARLETGREIKTADGSMYVTVYALDLTPTIQ